MFWHLYAEEQTVGRCPMVLSMSSQDDLRPRYPMSRRAFVSMVCGSGKHSYPGYRRRRAAPAEGAQRRPRARAVHGWVILVRSDSALAGGRTERHLGAEPLDHAA